MARVDPTIASTILKAVGFSGFTRLVGGRNTEIRVETA